jgi:osmotically-inducible protein OsmY
VEKITARVKTTDVRDKIEAPERQETERAAWAAPGVTQVEDRLAVVP